MSNEKQDAQVAVSNWTLATGTRPGERRVYATATTTDPPISPAPERGHN